MENKKYRAKKRFGQNFLIDKNIIRKIVQVINPLKDEHLVEIGPGLGALTIEVAKKESRLDLVEIDKDLIPQLEKMFQSFNQIKIHQANALKMDFSTLQNGKEKLRVIGNLPYNISTPLLFHLIKQKQLFKDMHFMLQKEVVDRLAARPGCKDYGRLSIMMQYFAVIKPLFEVPASSFSPAPKVLSKIVQITPREKPQLVAEDHAYFSQIVKQAFSQRRKTLRNSLKNFISAEQFSELNIPSTERPENLSVEDFVRLSNLE